MLISVVAGPILGFGAFRAFANLAWHCPDHKRIKPRGGWRIADHAGFESFRLGWPRRLQRALSLKSFRAFRLVGRVAPSAISKGSSEKKCLFQADRPLRMIGAYDAKPLIQFVCIGGHIAGLN